MFSHYKQNQREENKENTSHICIRKVRKRGGGHLGRKKRGKEGGKEGRKTVRIREKDTEIERMRKSIL